MFLRVAFTMILFLLLLNRSNARRYRRVTTVEQEELEKAQRNAECCAKNMRCCVKLQPPPIEIRAVIARCPNLGADDSRGHISRTMNKPVMPANEFNIKSFQGFDEDEPLIQSRVTDCRSKIIMTIKLHHRGPIICKSQYIVVDHVYDPLTDKSARLLNPYVIRLRQEPVSKSFHLNFVDYVNAEAREEVHNKQESNYTGCHATPRRSTCGLVRFDGKVIPFSEGFCCSCDPKKNLQRQPESHNQKNEEIISFSDPAYLLDRVGCPRNYYSDVGSDQLVHGSHVMNVSTGRPHQATEAPLATEAPQPPHDSNINCTKSVVRNIHPTPGGPVDVKKRTGGPTRWKYTTYSQMGGQTHPTTTYRPFYLKRELDVQEKQPNAYLKKMSTFATKKFNKDQYIDDVKKAHRPAPYLHALDPLDENREKFTARLVRKMRQTFPSGVQKRGGQNCADRYTPPNLDPEHYHESAHCLRFSDVWYGIYKLGEPSIEQIVYINIYERFETQSRSDKWREVTNGTIRLGNRFVHYEDDTPTISMTFTAKTLSDPSQFDDWDSKRILIPEGVRACEVDKHPEMRGGPEEYLVVPATKIALEGEQCDAIGVGFEAFYKQPQRCGLPRGTCLHNQPKHLWRNDKRMEQKGKMGCYFLKYHANITSEPLFVNETTGEKYLFVEYTGAHVTILDIEIKADQNSVIRDVSNAAITEVYVDSTCGKYTLLTIKVINTGLISSKFMVQLSDFPLELPDYFNKIRSKLMLISPQTVHIFNLEIKATLPSDLMYCSVEVLNKKNELVALRRVRIQKYDRCVCAWYCLCACVASVTGLKCNPMSLDHYHAAGFEGSLPIVTYMVHFTMLDDLLSVAFYFILFLLGILLLLGLFKALFGLCIMAIGMWGLSVVLDLPKPMKRYYERDLKRERVIYDEKGWPINPKTYKPARNISIATAFCSNLVFFYTYPLACTVIIFRRLCCPYYSKRPCPGAATKKEPKASCACRKKKNKNVSCGDPKCEQRQGSKKKCRRRTKHAETDDSSRGTRHEHSSRSSSGRSTRSNPNRHRNDAVVASVAHSKFKLPYRKSSDMVPPGKSPAGSSYLTVAKGQISKSTRAREPLLTSSYVRQPMILQNVCEEDVAAVTTSSEGESTTRSPESTPRIVERPHLVRRSATTAGRFGTESRGRAPSSPDTSVTSHEITSSLVTSSVTGSSFQTSGTSESIVAESVAVQTREDCHIETGTSAPDRRTNTSFPTPAQRASFNNRPKSL